MGKIRWPNTEIWGTYTLTGEEMSRISKNNGKKQPMW